MRILIVKLGSIGDIVHTLPALAVIRKAMPQAEISWVVERRSAEILRDNPLLDRLIEVDTKALRRGLVSGETLRAPRQQLRQLRASAFDLTLDFQGLLKSASIARLSGARRIFGFSRDSLRDPVSAFCCPSRFQYPSLMAIDHGGDVSLVMSGFHQDTYLVILNDRWKILRRTGIPACQVLRERQTRMSVLLRSLIEFE